MQILSENEILKIKEMNDFFDFDNIVTSDNKVIRYELDMDPIRDYSDVIFRMDYLTNLTIDVIKQFTNEIIIFNYEDKWLTREVECLPLRNKILNDYRLPNDFKGGFKVDVKDKFFFQMMDSTFRYNSFIGIIIDKYPIIISPSDHLDVFIHTNDAKIRRRIIETINKSEYGYAKEINQNE